MPKHTKQDHWHAIQDIHQLWRKKNCAMHGKGVKNTRPQKNVM